jgi:act minimal PKS acyl carrier protein
MRTATITIDDVRRILVACAGEGTWKLWGDISGVEFEDLGYDSLALMETAARIEDEFAVRIPENDMASVRTPGELVELVNASRSDVS